MRESEWVVFLADATIKSALLLGVVWLVVAMAMRRSSAAGRHLLWTSALGLSLLMPLLTVILPQWRILPGWNTATVQLQPAAVDAEPAASNAGRAAGDAEAKVPAAEVGPAGGAPAEPVASAPTVAAPPHRLAWSWQRYLLVGWGAGTVLLVVRMAVGGLLIQRMRRHAKPSSHLCESESRLLTSDRCQMPMAVGIFHPAVMVPQEAEYWDMERLKSVVDHEAAHLRRHDCLWQALGQLARAAYWPNPLVWLAHRQLLCEAEKACDDAVIAGGSKASAYAEHLLSIATSGRADTILAAAAIAMARPTTLEGRLMAILDGARNRKRVSFLGSTVVLLALSGLAVPLAMLQAQQPGGVPATAARPSAAAAPAATAGDESAKIVAALQPALETLTDASDRRDSAAMQEQLALIEGQVRKLGGLLQGRPVAARLQLAGTQLHSAADYLQKGDADWGAAIIAGLDPNLLNAVRAALGQEPAKPDAGPVVVSLTPARFARDVDPQLKEIHVTFDRAMAGGCSFVGGGPGFPKTTGRAHWVSDKTCVLPVKLESGHDYWLSLNNPNFTNFRSDKGEILQPCPIWFQTAGVNAHGQKPAGPPKVLKTEPAAGATGVDPAMTELRVTFDQPMMTQAGFSWVGGGESFPQTTGKPHWIDDRTCVLPVKLEPNHQYWFSANSMTYMNFTGAQGIPALPHPIQFTTGAGK